MSEVRAHLSLPSALFLALHGPTADTSWVYLSDSVRVTRSGITRWESPSALDILFRVFFGILPLSLTAWAAVCVALSFAGNSWAFLAAALLWAGTGSATAAFWLYLRILGGAPPPTLSLAARIPAPCDLGCTHSLEFRPVRFPFLPCREKRLTCATARPLTCTLTRFRLPTPAYPQRCSTRFGRCTARGTFSIPRSTCATPSTARRRSS